MLLQASVSKVVRSGTEARRQKMSRESYYGRPQHLFQNIKYVMRFWRSFWSVSCYHISMSSSVL
jgi:hypothetical protein